MNHPDASRRVRWLASTTVVATLLLIAMGGAVRATDSGLACPDWPACYGMWIPPADMHMWFEHSHRLWAGVVALLVLALAISTARRRRADRLSWRLSLLVAVLIVIQAGLGAAVVLLHLRAGLVTSHLGMSLVIVAALIVIAVRSRRAVAARDGFVEDPPPRAFARRAGLVAGLVFVQALLGGQATGRGAAYVFNAFPIWLATDPWTGHVREVLHVTHRVGGYVVAGAIIALAVHAHRSGVGGWAGRVTDLAVVLVVAQVALGVTNVLTSATVLSAIGHLTVASWLWSAVVLATALGAVRPSCAPQPPPVPDRIPESRRPEEVTV